MQISDSLIEQVVHTMGEEFDSHEIILKLAQDNQRIYVKALAAIDNDRPFLVLHSQLGSQIKNVCERLGYTSESARSKDIFGQNSKCLSWSKS